jgi:hypothetical protein
VSDLQQIRTALNRLFQEEDQRIVFWNDPDQEFLTTLPLLELDGVTTLRLDEETKTKPVTVQVLGSNHRITSAYCRFQLIQMDAVSDRVKPSTLKVAVYEDEEPVTDIQTVKFDSSSGNLEERKKWVNLVLNERQYNKKTPYRLVLREAETGIEQQSVEVIIDRAFTDDF